MSLLTYVSHIIKKIIPGLFLFSITLKTAAAESFDPLKIRKTFEVDSCQFKLGITQIAKWEYKIHISKKIDGKWQLQNRYIKNTDFYSNYQLVDWNKDNFTDIWISFSNGMAAENESYLFIYDSVHKKYQNIEKFDWYCGSYEPEKSINPTSSYYFSILKMGCSGDLNQSYLFTAEDFKLRILGSMEINYCEKPWQILIFKHDSENIAKKIATVPMSYVEMHFDKGPSAVAWQNYVAHYWIRHGLEYIFENNGID